MNKIKTKKVKSKKEKKWIICDVIFLIICFIITMHNSSNKDIELVIEALKGNNIFVVLYIIYLFIMSFVFEVFFKCFWLIVIYLAVRISRMKVIKENNKYEVIDNIEYYRDRFKRITPAEISMISDLEIETKKDISATILDMYQRQILDFEENNIIIKDETKANRDSEKELLEMIKENNFTMSSTEHWKKTCIEEAKKDGYILEKKKDSKGPNFSKNTKTVNVAAKIFIISMLIGVVYVMLPQSQSTLNKLNNMGSTDVSNDIIIKNLIDASPLIITESFTIYSLLILILTPFYRWVRKIFYKTIEVDDRYERTKEGNRLAEQIIGIKNYLHDFSNLKEKEKESIVLWEDFLIYAVVLEENELVRKDIYQYKNVNINVIEYIRKTYDINMD